MLFNVISITRLFYDYFEVLFSELVYFVPIIKYTYSKGNLFGERIHLFVFSLVFSDIQMWSILINKYGKNTKSGFLGLLKTMICAA